MQECAYAVRDGAADFHNKVATGPECGVGCGDEVLDDFEASWSGEDGGAGLEFANFELHLVCLGLADVGRIGDDEVEGCSFQAVQQVGVVEEEIAFELQAGGVGFGDFEGGGRDVGGVNLGVGQLLASASAMAPEPVPTSAIFGFFSALASGRTVSIRCSVSGRGISTAGDTIRSSPQNSWCPVMYCAGTPLVRWVSASSYRDCSSLVSSRSG